MASSNQPIDFTLASNRWMLDFIHTDAKPRKKPARRKKKWQRSQSGAATHQLLDDAEPDVYGAAFEVTPIRLDRPIPPLSEFCLAVIRQHNILRFRTVPFNVQAQLGTLESFLMKDSVLGCLAKFFENVEQEAEQTLKLARTHHYDGLKEIGIQGRTLFSPYIYTCRYLNNLQDQAERPACLPVTQMPSYKRPWDQPRHRFGCRIPSFLEFSAFPSYLNACLHPFMEITQKSKRNGKETRHVEEAVSKIQYMLKKRIPILYKACFDQALPYVFWARGNKELAEKYFLKAILNSKYDAVKAMLHNELGRMFITCNDPLLAPQCFMAAAEKSKISSRNSFNEMAEADCLVLTASSMDQGFLKPSMAIRACKLWQRVLENDTSCPLVVSTAAMTSLMTYHFAYAPMDNPDWWNAMGSVLLKCSDAHPVYFIALSLFKALDGYQAASQSYFDEFIKRNVRRYLHLYESIDLRLGQAATGNIPLAIYPWTRIVMASRGQRKVKPLPMIWRTLLTHPVYGEDGEKSSLFDISHPKSSMWMSEEGYITGDFHLLLPPVAQIKINPYTGSLVYPISQSTPGLWKNNVLPTLSFSDCDLYHMPNQIRLYEDETGITVDLYIVNHIGLHRTLETPHISIVWRKLSEVVKVDLKKDIRKMLKKNLDRHGATLRDTLINPELYKETFAFHMEQGLTLSHKDITDYCQKSMSHQRELANLEVELTRAVQPGPQRILKKKIRKLQAVPKKPARKFYVHFHSHTSVGATVVLSFGFGPDSIKDSFFYVFNCESSGNFRNFRSNISHNLESGQCEWGPVSPGVDPHKGLVLAPSGQGLHYPEASIFVVPRWNRRGSAKFTVFNKYGEELKTFDEIMGDEPSRLYYKVTCIIDQSLYGINSSKTRINCEDFSHTMCHQSKLFPEVTDMKTLGRHLLVSTVTGVYILNKNLQPLPWDMARNSLELADDDSRVNGSFTKIRIFVKKKAEDSQRILLSFDDIVALIYINYEIDVIVVMTVVQVPGIPTEGCYIIDTGGFFITSSILKPDDKCYHEELYQFNSEGDLVGILPFLGRGPHQFMPVTLPGHPDAAKATDEPALAEKSLSLFLFDGHGAICCVKPL